MPMPTHSPVLCFLLMLASCGYACASTQPALLWQIDVRFDPQTAILESRACSEQAAASVRFRAGGDAASFLRSAARDSEAPLRRRGPMLQASNWQAGECLQLSIDLAAAARAERYGTGQRAGHYLRIAISSWLWRPQTMHSDSRIRFELPEGWQVSMPWLRADDGSFELGKGSARRSAIGAFGRFFEQRRLVGDTELRIAVLPSVDDIEAASIAEWLTGIAKQLVRETGGLPQAQLQVLVLPLPGVERPVPWGEVTRGGGSAVHLLIGAEASEAALRADWTAWHEFSHLLHPYLGGRGRWLAEGLASYYQNLLRARSGEFDPAEAWRRLRSGFERGIAASANTATALETSAAGRERGSTMRVYWAGAAFWLETDLELHARGESLSDLLRRYQQTRSPLDCCASAESFVRELDALAPDVGIKARWRNFADSRDFPLSPEQLHALEQGLGDPGSALNRVLAPPAHNPSAPL